MIYLFPDVGKYALGRRGNPHEDFSKLCPDARIMVVGGIGILTPYKVLSSPERQDGEWYLRLHPMLDTEHSEAAKHANYGYHRLSSLGIVPQSEPLQSWNQDVQTFLLPDFANFYRSGRIALRGMAADDLAYVSERLRGVI